MGTMCELSYCVTKMTEVSQPEAQKGCKSLATKLGQSPVTSSPKDPVAVCEVRPEPGPYPQ